MKTYAIIYLGAMCVSLLLTPLVALLARAMGLVDLPGLRKVHHTPVPRVGGVAIFVSVVALVAPVLALNNVVGRALRGIEGQVAVVFVAAACVFLVGLVDDVRGLPSKLKLVALLGAALACCAAGVRIDVLRFGGWELQLGAFAWPLTVLWLVGVTVGINFTDGLDGLAAGICAVACAAVAGTALYSGNLVIAVTAFALLGSLTGFLFYNFNPARIFMGDCGSMFLGFLLAAACVSGAGRGGRLANLLLPATALAIPILDTALTMVRRGVLQRRSLFSAERGHVHHRLMDLGLRHRQVVIVLYAVTLLSTGIGTFMLFASHTITMALLGSVLVLLLLSVFRFAGSVKVGETLTALRRNRELGQAARLGRTTFEEMQLRLASVSTFDEWWREVCAAAGALGFVRLSLALVGRDGTGRTLVWKREAGDEGDPGEPGGDRTWEGCWDRSDAAGAGGRLAEAAPARPAALAAAVPVRHRRFGPPLTAEVEAAASSLEAAGHRIALFARLIEEHSIADLPEAPPRGLRPAGDAAGVDEPARDGPAAERFGRGLRIAVVHDFLYTYAGAERVLEQILAVVPQADVFSLFDFLSPADRGFLGGRPVTTSCLQRMPWARTKHRTYLPLMPLAAEQLDVSAYDVVISSSYVAAKGVITRPDQLHVCYCHTPVRFAWDLQHQYLAESGLNRGVKGLLARAILHYIRNWDARSSNGVDVFVTNSDFVARRIEKFYRRQSRTIYPPVDVDRFVPCDHKEGFYLTVSRMVPYKRIDLIVKAFSRMGDRRLIVVGEGPDFDKIKAEAGPNVKLVGHQSADRLLHYMRMARAFVFAAEEDFGIVPVEAQACGTPVIAFGRGGVTESVVAGRTGVFFKEQTVESLTDAVLEFEAAPEWDRGLIRANAERFSVPRFRKALAALLGREWEAFQAKIAGGDGQGTNDAGRSADRDLRDLAERLRAHRSRRGRAGLARSDEPGPRREMEPAGAGERE